MKALTANFKILSLKMKETSNHMWHVRLHDQTIPSI
jgi:hypothetical protein